MYTGTVWLEHYSVTPAGFGVGESSLISQLSQVTVEKGFAYAARHDFHRKTVEMDALTIS